MKLEKAAKETQSQGSRLNSWAASASCRYSRIQHCETILSCRASMSVNIAPNCCKIILPRSATVPNKTIISAVSIRTVVSCTKPVENMHLTQQGSICILHHQLALSDNLTWNLTAKRQGRNVLNNSVCRRQVGTPATPPSSYESNTDFSLVLGNALPQSCNSQNPI